MDNSIGQRFATDKLIIVTNNYPLGGRTEEAFLKDEIIVLARSFQQVVIMPMWKDSDCFDISFWPDNVILDDGLSKQYRERGKKRYLNIFNKHLFCALVTEIGRIRKREQLEYIIRTFTDGMALRMYLIKLINAEILNVNKTVIYSFWFADNAVGLGLMPHSIMPRWISRAHHYDLYDERVPIRSRYFRNRSFSNVEKVLCCSRHGEEYLTSKYPKWKDKIGTLYLGTLKPKIVPDYMCREKCIRFITVARLEPVKRPLMTFSFLSSLARLYPEYELSWIVAGGGSLFEPLKQLVHSDCPVNLSVSLLGEQSNFAVHSLLENQQFEWMIMLSESEGLPISFAEAMSYGIPVIATDVGGVKEEVITGISGLLLPANPLCEDLNTAISKFLLDQNMYLELRKTAAEYWERMLNGDVLKQGLVAACTHESLSS